MPRPAQVALELAALLSFIAHLASQVYLPSPSNSDNRAFYPNNYFIALYLSFNAALTIFWLYELSTNDNELSNDGTNLAITQEKDLDEVESMVASGPHLRLTRSTYLVFYISSNILLVSSSLTASQGLHDVSHLLLIFNFTVNLFFIRALTEDPLNSTITPANFLTHLVMKTNVGLCTLLLWKTWSNFDRMANPAIGDLVNAGLTFLLMTIASGPDPTLGLCLLFILLSLIVGDTSTHTIDATSSAWQLTFILTSVVIVACLLIEFMLSKRNNFPWLKGWNPSPEYRYDDPSPSS